MTTDTTATVSPLGKLIRDRLYGNDTGTAQMGSNDYTTTQRHSNVRDAEHYTNSVDIKSEAYEVPIGVLADLWLVKHGNEWVMNVYEKFWEVAAERLNQMGRLEKHYLTDRACYVYRIPK